MPSFKDLLDSHEVALKNFDDYVRSCQRFVADFTERFQDYLGATPRQMQLVRNELADAESLQWDFAIQCNFGTELFVINFDLIKKDGRFTFVMRDFGDDKHPIVSVPADNAPVNWEQHFRRIYDELKIACEQNVARALKREASPRIGFREQCSGGS